MVFTNVDFGIIFKFVILNLFLVNAVMLATPLTSFLNSRYFQMHCEDVFGVA
jgi:hypothetical protein